MSKTDESKAVVLPDWLEALLPEPAKPHVVSTALRDSQRVLQLTSPDGEVVYFEGLEELDRKSSAESWDLQIEEDVYEHFGRDRSSRMLSYESEKPGYFGMLLAHTDADRRETLEDRYRCFLEDLEAYENDPQSFPKAWSFIDGHPAFWLAYDLESNPWYWITEGHCSRLRQFVYFEEDSGLPVVRLETGGHVPYATGPIAKPYSEHFGDWRLEVSARSFEDAIVELAFRLSKSYDSQGNDLKEEDFPYETPEWVKDLRERITDGE